MRFILTLAIKNKIKPTGKHGVVGRPKKDAHVFVHVTHEEYIVEDKDIRLLNGHGDIEIRRNGRYYSYMASEIVSSLLIKR